MAAKVQNWWNTLGKPQYGGEIVIRANWEIENFDPYNAVFGNIHSAWLEMLITDDWTLDPAVFDFKPHWRPSQYQKGWLAESWEFTGSDTYVAHLRRGIHWQDIPPANGREFTAEDVVFHYQRMLGLGGGFTKPGPIADAAFKDLVSVTASDRYTVVFKFKTPNPEFIVETLHTVNPTMCLENPDAVKQWGNLDDWHHAVGTGPFMLKEFVKGNYAGLIKNPRYWGHDERYPENKLPYFDSVKYLIIPDDAAAVAAMRAGKIDIIDHISPMQAQSMRKTNPEILQFTHPDSNAASIEPRNDMPPFNDIRVRKALQLAIDLPALAKEYYSGTIEPYPATLTSRYMDGWGFPWEEWPQDLKDEYTYNPAAAKQLLANADYPDGFQTNIIVQSDSDMGLLQIIRAYFAQIGVDMEIRTMAAAEWNAFVARDHKHNQLAHRTVGPLGHTSAPNHDLALFQTGGRSNWAMVNDPVFNAFMPRALAASGVVAMKKVIREANEYVARQHFTIALLQPKAYSLCQPWVKGFNGQFGSAWAHGSGPAMLSFYLARFWIDRDLKKSMGR
ncbi:MAG: ABC transporter substrate-binding protein [Dehalococcoidales bacterium]